MAYDAASHSPSQIAEAFKAVGRDAPTLDACAELARALEHTSLDKLCDHVAAQCGSIYALRRYAPEYQAALREAAEPALWAERLLIEAAEYDRWAEGADAEASYRAETALSWRNRGDPAFAQRYDGEAKSHRLFAEHCREEAAERRAKAEALSQRGA